MTKKKEKVVKICMRCSKLIDNKDNYCCLKEWIKGKLHKTGYYHTHCFREGLHGNEQDKALRTKANRFLDKALNMVGVEN